ncbi:hypothetical protein AXG93_1409s1180 [Marchantia polymorpha subsp. ruderalis]|uniref:Uncharacterized protein n=1 Tax=Marchantia polymorpha subsp. ruderalis TaxID=1480154 RepID=A0A176WJR6_MARPO|nr:hypothetical protein AXG93_1409s1180 [Marchantia polymorpha subsp. ruderalis]
MVSLRTLSLERTRSTEIEKIPQLKKSEELVKELTLSDKILEQVVAQVGVTVVDAADITLPSSPVEDVRTKEEKKTSEEESKGVEITFSDFLHDSVVPLLKYLDMKREKYVVSNECAAAKAALKEREAQLREKEIECEVLQLNLAKESRRCAELEETYGGLRISNKNGQKMIVDLLTRLEKSREACDGPVKRSERLITTTERREKKHVEELAKLEVRRAEEVRIAEELQGKIPKAKTAEEDLRSKILEIAGKADMRTQESQRRMEKAEEAYRELRDESTNELKLRLKKCLNGFAMWGLQTVKWLKLDSLERRLTSTKTSGSVRHKQIVELVNSFSEGFNEARQNVEVDIVNVLRRIAVYVSSNDTVTATSDGTALETDSPQDVDIPELPL